MARTTKAKAPAKRGRGRPKSDNPANLRVNFRVTAEQRECYQDAAAAAGLTFTQWIEKQLDRASGRYRA